jgi:hypothetical protein
LHFAGLKKVVSRIGERRGQKLSAVVAPGFLNDLGACNGIWLRYNKPASADGLYCRNMATASLILWWNRTSDSTRIPVWTSLLLPGRAADRISRLVAVARMPAAFHAGPCPEAGLKPCGKNAPVR